METKDVAQDLVALCQKGDNMTAIDRYYASDIVSLEARDPMRETRGFDDVRAKNEWWGNAHEIHRADATGPWVNGDQFLVQFEFDATRKEDNQRFQLKEYALYTVENGKIVEERFCYDA